MYEHVLCSALTVLSMNVREKRLYPDTRPPRQNLVVASSRSIEQVGTSPEDHTKLQARRERHDSGSTEIGMRPVARGAENVASPIPMPILAPDFEDAQRSEVMER